MARPPKGLVVASREQEEGRRVYWMGALPEGRVRLRVPAAEMPMFVPTVGWGERALGSPCE